MFCHLRDSGTANNLRISVLHKEGWRSCGLLHEAGVIRGKLGGSGDDIIILWQYLQNTFRSAVLKQTMSQFYICSGDSQDSMWPLWWHHHVNHLHNECSCMETTVLRDSMYIRTCYCWFFILAVSQMCVCTLAVDASCSSFSSEGLLLVAWGKASSLHGSADGGNSLQESTVHYTPEVKHKKQSIS